MASTSCQTTSSPDSHSTPSSWDVFLSFRGKDTRHSFTSHLYSALDRYNIRTFRDDPALRCGDHISDTLLQAIRDSKIYIAVLSENYASSSWCLDELVEIFCCSKTMQRLVIPVFYKIDPSIVRYQTGSFEEDFRRHENRFAGEMERVKNWRLTLTQVAHKSGKHVDGKRSEADIVNEIVDEILLQIKPTVLYVTRYPVGLNSRVNDIAALLSSVTKGVIKIGIYGMGGVGKTTLAKALFNKLLLRGFKGSCFLENVRENSGTSKGLESLQQQIINDVLKSKNKVEVSSVGEGIKLIENRICSTKILVVIDDLDDHKEFRSLVGPFASGSVVIITTRDEETLDNIEIETKYRYRVDELGDAESETLLFQHAFGGTTPNNTLRILSKDILRLAGGLPLALEVYGSYLFKKPERKWKAYIETLQRIPNSSIQQRLLISLDALGSDDPLLKKMFLDIACFFIGKKKEKVVKILDTYYPYADDKIDILMKKCLLTINFDNEFRMHDLLQEMGKDIARNNFPDEPGKYSRLWVPINRSLLEKHKGTEAIEAIMPHSLELENLSMIPFSQPWDSPEELSFDMETLRRMSKLRFLHINKINLIGKFERTLEDLRWFRWDLCPLKCLPFDFCPPKLVILELPYNIMTTMWEVNKVSNSFKSLKTLIMSFSQYLTTTPDFKRLPCLENLDLEGCISLKEVHTSIESLVSLVSLNLKGCENLRSLPDTICNLKALEVLCIEKCTELEALPIQLGNIVSLRELNAAWLAVLKLPDSIGYLSKLVELKLDFNSELEYLPNTTCNLRALAVLSINYCRKMEALPDKLGNIKSLRELRAQGITVSKLPDSICNMRSLEILDIAYCCQLVRLPNQLWRLPRLSLLNVNGATLLIKLPDIKSSQTSLSLTRLDLSNIQITALPSGIRHLSNLQNLILRGCSCLWSIAELPPNLTRFDASGCISLESINLSNLKLLQELSLKDCTALTEILGLGEIISLKEMLFQNCHSSLLARTLTKSLFQIFSCFEQEVDIRLEPTEFRDWIIESSVEWSAVGIHQEAKKFVDRIIKSSVEWLADYAHYDLTEEISDRSIQSNANDNELAEEISSEQISDGSSQSNANDNDLAEEISFGSSLSYADTSDLLIESSVNLQRNLSHNYLGMILCFKMRDKLEYSVMTSPSNILLSRQMEMNRFSIVTVVPKSIFRVTETDHTIKFTSNARTHWIHLLYKNEDDSTTVNVEDD